MLNYNDDGLCTMLFGQNSDLTIKIPLILVRHFFRTENSQIKHSVDGARVIYGINAVKLHFQEVFLERFYDTITE